MASERLTSASYAILPQKQMEERGGQPSQEEEQQQQETKEEEGTGSEGGEKPTLKEKIKGKIMIATGALTGNEEKIEEGKNLLAMK